ncbi:MAG: hypothetical protein DHS20C18_10330 [Saprospiraceae bacterium]|nr:MAG: hypothetical protein DHS20C18_10330 [Saprospiraceae bacterium]
MVGYYNIIINEDYIITTYTSNTEDSLFSIISVVNMQENCRYLFDDNKLQRIDSLTKNVNDPNLSIISYQNTNEYSTLADINLECEKYYFWYNINNYINDGGDMDLKVEHFVANIDIIDKYIPNEEYRSRLAFIGKDYKILKKYTAQSNEITHSSPILISKIYETDYLNPELKEVLFKIKNISSKNPSQDNQSKR